MRKLSILLSFLLVFTFTSGSVAFAEREEISNDEMELILREMVDEINSTIDESILKSNSRDDINMESRIDESIDYNQELAEKYEEELLRNRSFFGDLYDKYIKITNIIERQYKLKKTFKDNASESISLMYNMKADINNISKELNLIFNSPDKELSLDDFYLIMSELKGLNLELKNTNYIAGSLVKESAKYIRQVTRLNISAAGESFETIVELQFQQIELLNAASQSIGNINTILNNR